MQNLFSLFILALVVQGIRSQWDYITEQREIASSPCPESNSNESQSKDNITSTSDITVDYEKFDDYELKKLFVKKFKLYKDSVSAKYKNEPLEIMKPHRKPRAVASHTTVSCRTCYAAGTSSVDEKCYKGAKVPITKCADAEFCFTEIHPEYLRRGCVLPGRVNRTFVCKCPLCNDKPSTESWHYEYTTINDWAYDNSRLSKRLLGMDLICKVCETKGVDPVQDQSCRSGKNTEYMVCPHNHICYTNIDDEIDFVHCESKENANNDKRTRKSELTKKKSVAKTDKMDHEIKVHASSGAHIEGNSTDQFMEHDDPRRSCINCNNVGVEDCNDPKNKLIQSVMCEHDDDLCYSMHTPFGIIDRGCYNSNHNLTTYVCSCNLCNYISISEMPYTFNTKQDWIDNVIEISRTRHFRKSIFKDMSCLRCEVNSTVQKADLIESANCLEGSIGNIPVEECEQNEVCAVKAHRAHGYIWRGCVRTPLYNYWWYFCDYDLCNYDTVLSLYDFI
ncbi:unnamed protein product [Arctia plantaginis]|uniref:Uncharacterized protein n=1 Tax=Arctia plantaginis TaxID=874455 RepID=A0A8S0Z281_ARCPL|nr:unnamed protein product [Arctia plantaginis]